MRPREHQTLLFTFTSLPSLFSHGVPPFPYPLHLSPSSCYLAPFLFPPFLFFFSLPVSFLLLPHSPASSFISPLHLCHLTHSLPSPPFLFFLLLPLFFLSFLFPLSAPISSPSLFISLLLPFLFFLHLSPPFIIFPFSRHPYFSSLPLPPFRYSLFYLFLILPRYKILLFLHLYICLLSRLFPGMGFTLKEGISKHWLGDEQRVNAAQD